MLYSAKHVTGLRDNADWTKESSYIFKKYLNIRGMMLKGCLSLGTSGLHR